MAVGVEKSEKETYEVDPAQVVEAPIYRVMVPAWGACGPRMHMHLYLRYRCPDEGLIIRVVEATLSGPRIGVRSGTPLA